MAKSVDKAVDQSNSRRTFVFIRKGTVMLLIEQGVQRLIAIGLRRESSVAIMQEVDKWRRNNGEEWTVDRLKSIKVDFARHLAGLPPVTPWVSRHPDGSPKGPFRVLWKLPKQQLFRAWNALMVYSIFVFTPGAHQGLRCSERQYRKFLLAVRRRDPGASSLMRGRNLIDIGLPPGRQPQPMVTRPLLHMYPKESVNSPVYMGGSVPQEQGILPSIVALAHNKGFCARYREEIMPVIQGFEDPFEVYLDDSSGPPLIGRVCWLQERGYKLRFVASPFPVYQRLLQPLGDYLRDYLKGIREDCTFDQEEGVRAVQGALLSGKRVYCYDLSNCSDHLPLELQLYMLRKMGVEERWVQIFSEISTGLWQLQDGHPRVKKIRWSIRKGDSEDSTEEVDDRFIRWRVGQPLGLYPSFFAFSLLHHSLVRGLFEEIHSISRDTGVLPNGDYHSDGFDYRILGDDLVIFDDKVGHAYPVLMQALGCPISETKTLISDQLGEFAGRVILPDKVVQGYKWKGRTDDSFVDVARNLGPSSMALFTPRQRNVLSVLAPVPEPWGFGWNPEGLSYADRLGDWEEANRVVKDRVPTADTRSRNVNRLLYSQTGSWHVMHNSVHPSLASDQDAINLVAGALGIHSDYLGVPLLSNVLEVPSDGSVLRKEILQDYGRLEAVSHCSALIRFEKEIRRVNTLRTRRLKRYPSWIRRWKNLL